VKRFLVAWPALAAAALGTMLCARAATPEYSIDAIRFADSPRHSVAELVVGAPKAEQVNVVFTLWLIRGGGRNILFDSGFHRARWFKELVIRNFLSPEEAVRLAGVAPDAVTDIIISHAHWDHLGGIDLFPKARIWIQKDEYRYYVGEAWQPGGHHEGIDPDDVRELVRLNVDGRVNLIDGDRVEIIPGIVAYTGARHTYASEYIRIAGNPPFVLASDNAYLYRNLAEHKASGTFSNADLAANIANQGRMIELAGSPDRVIPGHDALQFVRFPTQGRIAHIK
jgi:glyoxylase-like metal-dependent hydrolase (beta-lactamase superfamily II)